NTTISRTENMDPILNTWARHDTGTAAVSPLQTQQSNGSTNTQAQQPTSSVNTEQQQQAAPTRVNSIHPLKEK
ncbi:unnamed protein product, partial [Rotaria sp. Silwood1]